MIRKRAKKVEWLKNRKKQLGFLLLENYGIDKKGSTTNWILYCEKLMGKIYIIYKYHTLKSLCNICKHRYILIMNNCKIQYKRLLLFHKDHLFRDNIGKGYKQIFTMKTRFVEEKSSQKVGGAHKGEMLWTHNFSGHGRETSSDKGQTQDWQ